MKDEYAQIYLEKYRDFMSGNYEYGTISNADSIKNALSQKKIVVLGGSNKGSDLNYCISSVFIIIGLILGIALEIFIFIPFLLVSLPFLISGIKSRKEHFLIMGEHGILLKRYGEDLEQYNWNEIDFVTLPNMTTYRYRTSIFDDHFRKSIIDDQFYIIPKNGEIKVLDPFEYKLREFSETNDENSKKLCLLLFMAYRTTFFFDMSVKPYDFSKAKNSIISELYKDADKIHDNLKRVQPKHYKSVEEIRNQFLQGNNILIKGHFHPIYYLIIVLFYFLGFMLISIILSDPTIPPFIIVYYLIFCSLFFLFPIFVKNYNKKFILIGPSGIIYKLKGKDIRRYSIRWEDVGEIIRSNHIRQQNNYLHILPKDGLPKITFNDTEYLKRIFPRKQKTDYFILSFLIYWNLHKQMRRAYGEIF